MRFIVTVLGAVLVIEGIPWFLSPAMMRRFLRQLGVLTERQLRLYGLVIMLAGLLIVRLATG